MVDSELGCGLIPAAVENQWRGCLVQVMLQKVLLWVFDDGVSMRRMAEMGDSNVNQFDDPGNDLVLKE